MVKIDFYILVCCAICPYYIANLLSINKLVRSRGVWMVSTVRWGATLKNFLHIFQYQRVTDFVTSKIWLKIVLYSAYSGKMHKILAINKFGK